MTGKNTKPHTRVTRHMLIVELLVGERVLTSSPSIPITEGTPWAKVATARSKPSKCSCSWWEYPCRHPKNKIIQILEENVLPSYRLDYICRSSPCTLIRSTSNHTWANIRNTLAREAMDILVEKKLLRYFFVNLLRLQSPANYQAYKSLSRYN